MLLAGPTAKEHAMLVSTKSAPTSVSRVVTIPEPRAAADVAGPTPVPRRSGFFHRRGVQLVIVGAAGLVAGTVAGIIVGSTTTSSPGKTNPVGAPANASSPNSASDPQHAASTVQEPVAAGTRTTAAKASTTVP